MTEVQASRPEDGAGYSEQCAQMTRMVQTANLNFRHRQPPSTWSSRKSRRRRHLMRIGEFRAAL